MRARGVVVVVVVVAVGVATARTFTYIAAITGSKAPMHDTHFRIYVENTNNPLLYMYISLEIAAYRVADRHCSSCHGVSTVV